jgi:anti-sigma regulatory factor (Ser/Thr protein kinase)
LAVNVQHVALLHAGEESFVASASAFVRQGLAADEAVMVTLTASALRGLQDELGEDGGHVQFVDAAQVNRNPGTALSAWHDFVENWMAKGRGMRGVGQPAWPGRSEAELNECHRHEALMNAAFDDGPAWSLLCPYDTTVLSAETIEAAVATHPLIAADGEWRANPGYEADSHRPFDGVIEEPPAHASPLTFDVDALHDVRAISRGLGAQAGLPPQRRDDLALAVSEIGTNSLVHGGGRGQLWAWSTESSVVCEVHDDGRITDALVGRRRPVPTAVSGRGLWLAHQLCDLVQVRSDDTGTVVRLSMSID